MIKPLPCTGRLAFPRASRPPTPCVAGMLLARLPRNRDLDTIAGQLGGAAEDVR